MIYSIYPDKDATIYDASIYQNTGLDEIAELRKVVSGSSELTNTNSRILMKFDMNEISTLVSSGVVSNAKFYLNMYTLDAIEIPLSYTVEVRAVSESWEMGVGKYADDPQTTNGVSWRYRDRYLGTAWASGSYAAGSEGAYDTYAGGGTWYTAYQATQSFEFDSTDLRIDVTDIVNAWLSGSIANDGFIIKRLSPEETSSADMGILQFFSRDTHTIYPPKLEIVWDDSTYTTGSLTELTSNDTFLIYSPNLEKTYKETSKAKLRIIGREKYPTRTYSTQSVYTTVSKCLPTSSYYSVIDATSQDTVIPFDTEYTKLSCDANGNYVKLWMNQFQPERIYRLRIKVVTSDTEDIFDDFIFKVVK